jgi:hypothetical protein
MNLSARQLGWDEDMGQTKRRRAVLESCHNRPLKAARILQNTAKLGRTDEVRRKAKADSSYFYRLHERNRGR